jgi:hypothetical protein
MTFTPDEKISEVLDLLRDENLGWISDEIEEAIAAGKPETFIVRESRSGGKKTFELGERISSGDASVSSEKTRIKLLPFSVGEQVEILASTLETYTAGIAKIIETISLRASEVHSNKTDGDPNITFTLVNNITDESFSLGGHDSASIEKTLKSIRGLLSDLTLRSEQDL